MNFFSASFEFGKYSHEFVTEVIEIYKNQPCLWNTETKEFLNHSLKAKAYEILVEKFKEVDPNANKDTVIRTINHMKRNYINEIKKIKEFSQLVGEGDVYTSELWYFDHLNFLQIPLDTTQSSISTEEDIIEQVG